MSIPAAHMTSLDSICSLSRFKQTLFLLFQLNIKWVSRGEIEIGQNDLILIVYTGILWWYLKWSRNYLQSKYIAHSLFIVECQSTLINIMYMLTKTFKDTLGVFYFLVHKAKLGTSCHSISICTWHQQGFRPWTTVWAPFEGVTIFSKRITESQREKSNYSLKNSLPIINNKLQLNNNRCSTNPKQKQMEAQMFYK